MRTAIPVTTRPFAPADAAFVARTWAEAFAEYDGGSSPERAAAALASRGTRAVIAERAGTPVGFAVYSVRGAGAHLEAIAVARSARGHGAGARLLRAAERGAAALGAREMRLETGEANLAAMELFVRAGYIREGRVRRYYRTGYDALVYAKTLRP